MGKPLRVLVIEDSEDDTALVLRALRRAGYEPTSERVETASAMKDALRARDWDVVLSDYSIPGLDFPGTLGHIREHMPDLPIILVTGSIGEEQAVSLIKLGVWDFVLKGNLVRLAPAIERALQESAEHRSRTEAENALRESEKRFAAVFQSSPIGISIARFPGGKFFDVNPAFVHLFGYTREEVIGHSTTELGIWADSELLTTLSEKGNLRNVETRCRRKSGEIIDALISVELMDLGGEKVVLGLMLDVTQNKKAQRELEQLKQRIEFILGATRTGLDIIDSQYNIRYVDSEWQKIYGDPAGKKCYEYFKGAKEPCANCGLPRAFSTKTVVIEEEALPSEGGRTVQVTTFPFTDENGEWLAAEVNVDITQRKKAEEALRESEERLRLFVEHAPAAIAMLDREMKFLGVSQRWMADYRLGDQSVLGRNYYDVFPEVPQRWKDMHRRCLDGAVEKCEEEPFPRQNGELDWVRWEIHPWRRKDGEIGGILLFSEVITERKRAEAALRESDAALRALVNANPESAVLIDIAGTILAANETIARRFGTVPQRMIGARLFDLLPAEVAESRRTHFNESTQTGKPLRFEDVRSGRCEDNYVHPIKDERGNVSRLVILGIDVTERKQTEEKLREQAALLEIASDAILVKDMENRVLYWSKGAQRIFGWSSEEARGRDTADLLFSRTYAHEAREALEETLAKGEWHGDLHQRTKDGRELVVEGRWTLMRDEHGQPKGILAVDTDVTSQRSIQAQLLRSQRLESLGTLAGGIAHDLNNVLSPILMGVEGLSFSNPDASTRQMLEIMKTSAQRGANIVRQILHFARGMEGAHGEVQPKHVLREIEQLIRETFPRSIVLKSEIPRDLWTVTGDATQLHQVLMNLCVNARDAMPDGGELTLSASNVQLDEAYAQMNIEAKPIRYTMLKVEDTGIGMSAGVLAKIFDPFFTTKEVGKGTGLGLSTAHAIVKSHGGFINVYSEPGKGASFKVYIPAAEKAPPAHGEDMPEKAIPMGEGELILLVEDEISLRDISRQILESNDYRVVTATDGAEALALYVERKSEIRLVITDMMMPYMDGAATIRAIRKIDPKACIIATSGLMVSEYAKEAKDLGAQEFLAKPYMAETLLQTIREVLERASAPSTG